MRSFTRFFTSIAVLALLPSCGPGRAFIDSGPSMDVPATDDGTTGTCSAPFMMCGSLCVNPGNDNANCGRCGNGCPSGQSCVTGMCLLGCPSGQTACHNNSCVSLMTDRTNCGACGTMCAPGQVCSAGTCATDCGSMLMTCTRAVDGGMVRYCANVQTDVSNCGTCGSACAGGQVCSGGMCTASCPMGESMCGALCVDLTNDHTNCGTCGHDCGGQVCTMGACATTCAPGQMFCTGRCVNTATDVNNCGGCGTVCPAGQLCVSGSCSLVCPAGASVCGTRCVNLQTDPTHCGACTTACGAGMVCSMGACAATCAAGTTSCGGACVDLTVNQANCGACGHACLAGQFCTGGTCGVMCMTGQTNCSGTCVNTNVDPANCGACGVTCGAGYACASGLCTPLTGTDASGCTPPSIMCGTACTDIRADNLNCGGCGRACTPDLTCVTGMCVAPCAAGQTRCGTACTDTTTDRNNCGTCGTVCPAGMSCVASACVVNPTFQINTLTASGCMVVNPQTVCGFERGGIAVSSVSVFDTGSTSTGRFAAMDLSGGASAGAIDDGIVADLQSGNAYVLEDATNTQPAGPSLAGSIVITHLEQLDATTGARTATAIALSMPIRLAQGAGLFSGYGRIILFSGVTTAPAPGFWEIRLPSGAVTSLRTVAGPSHEACGNWAYWGIAEFFGGDQYVDFVGAFTNTIQRYRVRDGMLTTLATFSSLGNICSITFSPTLNRWYFHHSGFSQFSSMPVTLGYCPGTFSMP